MSTSPRRLGKYELHQPIGQGHIGEVWQAHDLAHQRDVALKLFHSDLLADPNFLQRLTNGGPMLTSLRQDNLVNVYEATIARSDNARETTAFIAMDYIEGYTLRDYLQATSQRGAFPPLMDILYLFCKLGMALDHLHRNTIVHGDIIPNNILLNSRLSSQHFAAGEPMLTDVAITQIAGRENQFVAPQYISPEQAQGNAATNRSDIYALGIILYEICTGVVPFRSENTAAILTQHIRMLPAPPMLINASMPPALSEVILRAIAKEPAARFPSAAALTNAIAQACNLKPSFELPQTYEYAPDTNRPGGAPPPQMNSILGVPQPVMPAANPIPVQPPHDLNQPMALHMAHLQDDAVTPNNSSRNQKQTAGQQFTSRISSASGKQFVARPVSLTHIPNIAETPQQATPTPEAQPFIPPSMPDEHIASMPQVEMYSASNGGYTTPVQQTLEALPFPQPPRSPSEPTSTIAFKNSPTYKVVIALVILMLLGGGALGINAFLSRSSNPTSEANQQVTIYGRAFFQDDALGQNDQLQLTMSNMQNPAKGKAYYAWLQNDTQQDILLGKLTPQDQQATLHYNGNNQHSNLLANIQGLIITSEQDGTTPTTPDGDIVYRASFNQDILPDLKAILYMTPELPGEQPVSPDLLNAIKSMNDKATSIVDSLQSTHDTGLATRQATRIIETVDGTAYARSIGDLPANIPPQLNADVGLISSPMHKGYLDILSAHLQNLKAHAGNNPTLLMRIQNVENALTDLTAWVQQIRTYDVQLLKAAPDLENTTDLNTALQLKQLVSESYTGSIIPPDTSPTTKLGSAGAQQAYTEAQYMAELDLTAA